MNKIKMTIWGREFELPVYYKFVDEDSMTEIQKGNFEDFIENKELIDSIKQNVIDYVINYETSEIDFVDNIFKYVIPKCIYFPNEKGIYAVMCNFKFDFEHGMAIVFENNKFKTIGEEDIVL